MKNLFTQLTIAALAPALAISPLLSAQAKDEEQSPQWYQIEVLIFSHHSPEADIESWPQELGLKYPQRIVELKQTAATEILLNDPAFDADIFAATTNNDSESETPITDDQSTGKQPDTTPLDAETANIEAAPTSLEPSPAPLVIELGEQPFTLLAQDQYSFAEIKQKLLRKQGYRQLFHQAWRQPINSRDQAESILIQGGDKFDNHHELEGSITIGLERYLHIKTDLWLSTFVSNTGQDENPWPVLPKVPVANNATITAKTTHPLLGDGQTFFGDSAFNNNYGENYSNSFEFENPFQELAGNLFSVERTVVMRQQRRMRSNELHYIDHPLMGLLVRITTYEFPEPEEEVSTEAAAISNETNVSQ